MYSVRLSSSVGTCVHAHPTSCLVMSCMKHFDVMRVSVRTLLNASKLPVFILAQVCLIHAFLACAHIGTVHMYMRVHMYAYIRISSYVRECGHMCSGLQVCGWCGDEFAVNISAILCLCVNVYACVYLCACVHSRVCMRHQRVHYSRVRVYSPHTVHMHKHTDIHAHIPDCVTCMCMSMSACTRTFSSICHRKKYVSYIYILHVYTCSYA